MLEKDSASNPAYSLKPTLRFAFSAPSHAVALFFGAGVMRPGPGTWGSAAAAAVFLVFEQWLSGAALFAPGVIAYLAGIWAAQKTGEDLGVQDAGAIVIDEVAAVWLLLAVLPAGAFWALAGFAAFRVFDIVKLPPASTIDRTMHSGAGVMLDDLFAAIWALVAIEAIAYFCTGAFAFA